MDPVYLSMHDSIYFFEDRCHPISLGEQEKVKVNFLRPKVMLEEINYEINSEDEFNDLLGSDIEDRE